MLNNVHYYICYGTIFKHVSHLMVFHAVTCDHSEYSSRIEYSGKNREIYYYKSAEKIPKWWIKTIEIIYYYYSSI